jgi:hypothetical protein
MGEIRILDGTGDTKIIWNKDNDVEAQNAHETFAELTGKGFKAYSVRRGGGKGVEIEKFNADAEKLILVPPMCGG